MEVSSDDVIVTVQDARTCKLCMSGCRFWFGEKGLDWTKFVTEGYPASVLAATGDHLCQQAIDAARGRVAQAARIEEQVRG